MYCSLKEKEVKITEELELKDPKKKTLIMSHKCTGAENCDMTKHQKCLFNDKR